MGIIRSWICENARCVNWFDSDEPNPDCPKCHCVRVSWRPNGGHMGGHAKDADDKIRALAEHFSMTNMNSSSRDKGAKIVRPQAPASGPVHTFNGGFSAAINPAMGAQCVPTTNHIDYKVKATPGHQLGPGGFGAPGISANTAVEARHKP